ncbi:ABC transporter substrate-binding protein [Humibacter antri]
MIKKQSVVVGLTIAAAASLVLSGCTGGSGTAPAKTAASAGALNIGNFADVTNWDPSKADIGFDGPYLSAVYDGLVAINGKGEPTPSLATSWNVAADGLTVTFHLRAGVKFSDGESFDAAAAVKSLEYLKRGARSGEAYVSVKDFRAENADTVVVDLTRRDSTMLALMAMGRSWMMAPKAIDAGTLAKDPIGSGPYTLDTKASLPGSKYVFDKVKGYWDAKQFPFDTLSIQPIQDATARDNAMMSGQINVNYGDETAVKQAAQQDWNVQNKPSQWVGLQFTDHAGAQPNPFAKVQVRQAMNYAFDGAAMLKTVGNGLGADSHQVFPVGMGINDSALDKSYVVNIAKAKKLLADAGYSNGFSLHMPMAQPFTPWQAAVDQVFKQLGIALTWDNMQYSDYMSKAPTYPAFIAVLTMYSNPVLTVERPVNRPQWFNPNPQVDKFPELQNRVDTALDAAPGAAQQSAIKAVNTWLVDNAWFDVWYQNDNTYISTKNITVTPVVGMMFPTLRQIQPAG